MLREEVISALEGSRGTPVVCVSAGPGWGKTTLLAQWATQSQRPFAWVSVDDHDNDPIVLLTYVATALDRVSPLDPGVFDALASPGVSVEATVVPRLGAALTEVSEPVVVVLDDLHLLDSRASLDAIEALTRHVPNGSQMALSARGGPVLPLAASRARGLALEIGPDDLRMDEAEAGQLLSAAGLDLPDDRVAELTDQTEGWSAGLYLAALSLRARGHRAKGVDGVFRERPARVRIPAVGAARTPLRRRSSLPQAHRRAGADVGAALRRGSRGDWLRGSSRVTRGLQPLSGAAGRQRRVVPIPPSLPGRAPCGAGQRRAGSRPFASHSCERMVRGERAARGGRRVRTGGRRRRAGWHGWSERYAVAVYQTGRGATAERWLDWLEAQGALGPERGDRACSARFSLRCAAGLRGRSVGPRRPKGPSTTARCLTARPRSTAWLAFMRAHALSEGGGRDARGCGTRAPDALPREPPPTGRRAAPRGLAPAGRRDRPGRRPVRQRRRGGRRAGSARSGGGGARRARRRRDRSRRMGRGRGIRRASPWGRPPGATWRSTPPAHSYARWQPASRFIAGKPSAPTSSSLERNAFAREPRTRAVLRGPDTPGARARLPDDRRRRRCRRRCCARSGRCCADSRTWARSSLEVEEAALEPWRRCAPTRPGPRP